MLVILTGDVTLNNQSARRTEFIVKLQMASIRSSATTFTVPILQALQRRKISKRTEYVVSGYGKDVHTSATIQQFLNSILL